MIVVKIITEAYRTQMIMLNYMIFGIHGKNKMRDVRTGQCFVISATFYAPPICATAHVITSFARQAQLYRLQDYQICQNQPAYMRKLKGAL